MTIHQQRPSLSRADCHTTEVLTYCVTYPAEAGGKFLIDALLKTHGGVHHLCATSPDFPGEELLTHLCLLHGKFSARPYVVGQPTDNSTYVCVMALFYDFCRRSGLDGTELLVKAYPLSETAGQWDEVTWRRVLDGAEWQGMIFPSVWTNDALIGLFLSLIDQKRQRPERLDLSVLRR